MQECHGHDDDGKALAVEEGGHGELEAGEDDEKLKYLLPIGTKQSQLDDVFEGQVPHDGRAPEVDEVVDGGALAHGNHGDGGGGDQSNDIYDYVGTAGIVVSGGKGSEGSEEAGADEDDETDVGYAHGGVELRAKVLLVVLDAVERVVKKPVNQSLRLGVLGCPGMQGYLVQGLVKRSLKRQLPKFEPSALTTVFGNWMFTLASIGNMS